jgi:hypothetical protein
MAMMAITTSNSMSVNAEEHRRFSFRTLISASMSFSF